MNTTDFSIREIGVTDPEERKRMIDTIGVKSVDDLIHHVMPSDILLDKELDLPEPMSERELIEHINELGEKNQIFSSYIGMGWYDTCTPAVIQRNILENPAWYTSYTPYQAEVSQGRLEALFNFQTVITELTRLPLTNCSLLDEATAAAEACAMLLNVRKRAEEKTKTKIFVSDNLFTTTRRVIETRASQWDCELVYGCPSEIILDETFAGAVVQYTNDNGQVIELKSFLEKAKKAGVRVAVAADLMSLVLMTPPGEMGADIVFGSSQRFGVPMYFGGPSAGYLAATDEYKRIIPGRIIGVTVDRLDHKAFRLALQTREQHIKRERATSNICTAQALLATIAGMYAVYHGPEGLRDIAGRIHTYTVVLDRQLRKLGYKQANTLYFDTLKVVDLSEEEVARIRRIAEESGCNFRYFADGTSIGISLDETTEVSDLATLFYIFTEAKKPDTEIDVPEIPAEWLSMDEKVRREDDFMQQEVFSLYHTETELMRYCTRLGRRDLSLADSMISLGSCTMKLNPAASLFILSNAHFSCIHPYAPSEQVEGYLEMIDCLGKMLCTITGFDDISFMPNSGAAGEYAGLRTIREYFIDHGQEDRKVILLPESAHGTNPASTSLAGLEPVIVKSTESGVIDVEDFRTKAEENKDRLAGTMITYPSTYGIFEVHIRELLKIVHDRGGLVYMDGANMNGQCGWTNPGFIGADVCHLNLHKTFAIPHGGGGPGEGCICMTSKLAPYKPSHPLMHGEDRIPVSSAPFGSAGILGITYAYIRMMGAKGLKAATAGAILNSNYLSARLKEDYGVLYRGETGFVGHECIVECRNFGAVGITDLDIAKRLMDYNYHAPTLSFPVHGTLMVEPTESESLKELDRFVEVMKRIRADIQEIMDGKADVEDNVLKNAPHPLYEVATDEWSHPYTREKAAFDLPYLHDWKHWVNVARVNDGYGDRNLVCCYIPAGDLISNENEMKEEK